MTIYKPMTPSLRRKIDKAYDSQMAELNECEDNCYVQMLRHLYGMQRNLLSSLPDGYLIPSDTAQLLAYESGKASERPKEGEWIDEAVPVCLVGKGNRQCRCSLCGHRDIQAKTQKVPYCWFCGAKMNEKHIADKEV